MKGQRRTNWCPVARIFATRQLLAGKAESNELTTTPMASSAPRGADIFFHNESVYEPSRLQVGDQVLFASFNGGGADRAHPVMKLG